MNLNFLNLVLLLQVITIVVRSSPPEINAISLQKRLNVAVKEKISHFNVVAEEYYFNSAPFLISNAVNMTITFDPETTLWFEVGAGVRIDNSQGLNIMGNNMKIDYDPPPFFQGTFIDVHQNSFLIKTDIGFPDPDMFYTKYSSNHANEFIQGPQFWSAKNNYTLISSNFINFNADTQITKTKEKHIYRYTPPNSTAGREILSIGDKMSVIIRLGFTYHLHKCEKVNSYNITIYSSSFMAITEFNGIGHNTYNGMKVIRRNVKNENILCGKKQRRLCFAAVASNADVFHSSGMKFGPKIRDCEFSFAMDDYCNVHSRVQISFGGIQPEIKREKDSQENVIKLVIADPRLVLDHFVPDDNPYGTVETMFNAKQGDRVSFRELKTLKLVSYGTIYSKPKQYSNDTEYYVIKAEQLLKNINKNNKQLHPLFNPLEIIGKNLIKPRLWEVEIVLSSETFISQNDDKLVLESINNRTLLFELTDWNNSGSVFENNLLHNSIDGLRWKSSNGIIRNNVWKDGNRSLTGLEITPLRSYLEGPLRIENVTIINNTFLNCQQNSFITECTGMSHRADPTFSSCSDIKRIANRYKATLPKSKHKELNVHFEPPVLVHQSFHGQHAWFSSILCPNSSELSDDLLLTMSLGGDGTPCPPPGGKPQNCSMSLYSNNGGKSWSELSDWGHEAMNEVIPLDDGSFIVLGYGTKFLPSSNNMTAVQTGWQGKLFDNGTLTRQSNFPVHFISKDKPFPPVFVRSGSVVTTKNGWITTMYGHGEGKYHTKYTQRPAIYIVETKKEDDFKSWNLISTIEWVPEMGTISDGPGEPSMTRLLNDGRILMIFRADSMKPYWKTYSSDDGYTWTIPVSMVSASNYHSQWSVKPRLRQVPNKPLLVLAGGRPGLFLWISEDFGNTWSSYNIAAIHNVNIQPTKNEPNVTKLKYNDQVVLCNNYTDHRALPQPATSSYFGISFSKDNSLVLSYDRLSDGWHGSNENGTWGNFDALFTMRVQLSLS